LDIGLLVNRIEFSLTMFAGYFVKEHASAGKKLLNSRRSLLAITPWH